MRASVIVWDLETVPDLGGFAAANDLVGKSDVEVREAIGEKFPKHIYHSIVCIGALIAHRETDHWAVDAIGSPHVGERPEKQLSHWPFVFANYRKAARVTDFPIPERRLPLDRHREQYLNQRAL